MRRRSTPSSGSVKQGRRPSSILASFTAFALALTLAACSSDGSAKQSGGADELVWGMQASPPTLFAPTNYSTDGQMIMSLVQDQLLTYSPSNELMPAIAEDWTAVDSTTYTYTIRSDAKFSDGTPVTAGDVAYSLNLQLDPKVASQQASLMADVDSVTADGDVVTVKLKQPNSRWQFLPASVVGYVWKKDSVEPNLSSYGTPQTFPIGSGPYKVDEFVPDSHITLVRNPHYWGDEPEFDKVTIQIIPDEQTMQLAMRSGEIDGTFNVPTESMSQWKSFANVQTFPNLVWRGLTVDMDQAPFNDIHVRKALYYGTDREAIVDGLFPDGLATPSTTVNAPGIFSGALDQTAIEEGYDQITSFEYSVEKAKQELAQSSVPNGFSTTLNVPDDSSTIISISEALKDQWAKIGVDLELNLMPGGPRFQVILDHKPNLGVQVIGNLPDVPDPVQMVEQYFSSAQAAENGNNSSNFRDAAVDALIDQAETSSDPVESANLAMQAQTMASAQVPVIPLLWGNQPVAVRQGWDFTAPSSFYSTSMWINSIQPG